MDSKPQTSEGLNMVHQLKTPVTVIALDDFINEHNDKTISFEMPVRNHRAFMARACRHNLLDLINTETIKVVCRE